MVISIDLESGEILEVKESENVCDEKVLYDQFARSTLKHWMGLSVNAKKAHEPSKFNGQFL